MSRALSVPPAPIAKVSDPLKVRSTALLASPASAIKPDRPLRFDEEIVPRGDEIGKLDVDERLRTIDRTGLLISDCAREIFCDSRT